MEMTRRQASQILGATSLLTLTGCASRFLAPTYSTSAQDANPTTFGSRDFRSKIPTFDFGRSGYRIIGALPQDVKITGDNGEISRENVYDIWTLKGGADPEYGYDIDSAAQRIELRRPDNKVRVFVDNEQEGIMTDKTYAEAEVPRNKLRHVRAHPEFSLPAYDTEINGKPARLFYATCLDEKSREVLGIVPNATRFWLNKGTIEIGGRVYEERLVKIEKIIPSPSEDTGADASKQNEPILNPAAVITGRFITVNPSTGEAIDPTTGKTEHP
ncbi:MAG: hypothetical protein ABIG28_01225 [archaeon]